MNDLANNIQQPLCLMCTGKEKKNKCEFSVSKLTQMNCVIYCE